MHHRLSHCGLLQPSQCDMLHSGKLRHLLDWRGTRRRTWLHELTVQVAGQELKSHSVNKQSGRGQTGWTRPSVMCCCCHLLEVEVHVEVSVEGQRCLPRHPPQGQDDGAIVGKEVEQVLLITEGTHPTL